VNRITFASVTGTGLWVASAIKVLGYVWTSFTNTYDSSAFQIGGGGSGRGPGDIPIIPPVERKKKPGGKKTKLPRLKPIPVIPPVRRQYPSGAPAPAPAVTVVTPPGASPWDTITEPGFSPGDILNPSKWGDWATGLLGSLGF
jgi:hypothetical protein